MFQTKKSNERTGHTLLPVEAMIVESDVGGVAAADVLLHRPYHLAEPPVTTWSPDPKNRDRKNERSGFFSETKK
jgi:hypothetical protein